MSNHNDKNKSNSGELLTSNVEDNPEPSEIFYRFSNKPKSEQTARASKYPQGYFKEKPCKLCSTVFTPNAPSEMYCSDYCKDLAELNKYLLRNYNIDYKDYQQIYNRQNGKCFICQTEGFTMAEHHRLKLVVDHCHTTGTVRGLLCHNCNRALGLLKDNTEYLNRAIKYLEGATTIPNGSTL